MSAVADFAELSVLVQQTGVDKTIADLARLTAAGDAAEKSVNRLRDASGRLVSSMADASSAGSGAARAADGLGQSTANLVAHTEQHAFAMGRAIRATEGLAVESLGLNHQLTTLGVLLAEFGAGHGPVLVAVAAIAALGIAYEKLTEQAREQAEEQEKLTKSLEKWHEEQQKGLTTERLRQIDAEKQHLKDLTDQYDALKKAAAVGQSSAGPTGLFAQSAGTLGTQSLFQQMTGTQAPGALFQGQVNSSAEDELKKQIKDAKELIEAAEADARAAIEKTIATTQLELDRRKALTAAYGEGALTLAMITDHYDKLAAIQGISADATAGQRQRLVELFDAIEQSKDLDALNDAIKKSADYLGHMDDALKSVTVSMSTVQALSVELTKSIPGGGNTVAALGSMLAALQFNIPVAAIGKDPFQSQQDAAVKLHDTLMRELGGALSEIAAKGFSSWSDLFRDIERLAQHAGNAIDSALSKLSPSDQAKYQGLSKALSVGTAAVGGIVGAYDVGYSANGTTSAGLAGAASGASAGAAIGTAIAPGIGTAIGAVSGAIDGFVIGLFGQASKIKELRKQYLADEQKYIDSLASYPSSYASSFAGIEKAFKDLEDAARAAHSSVSADAAAAKDAAEQTVKNSFLVDLGRQFNALGGPAGAFANALDDINQKYEQNIQTIRQLGLGEGALNEAEQIRTESIRQLILAEANLQGITDGLISRLNSITGGTAAAGDPFASLRQAIADAIAAGQNDVADALKQELGLDIQFNAYLDGLDQAKKAAAAQQTFNDAMKSLAEATLQATQQSAQALQTQIDTTQKVVDGLQQFRDSLKLNLSLTTLSPRGQLDEANRQYRALLSSAMGGDATAASGLPQAAQTYLGIAKSYYGSTNGYVNAFNDVQSGVGAVQDKFGAALDIQSLMLRELQKANTTLSAQLDVNKNQAILAAYQAAIEAAKNAPAYTDEQGHTISQVNNVVAAYQKAYPGIQYGNTTPGNALDGWGNTPFSELPGNLQDQVRAQHLRWLVSFDPDGNGATYQQFAAGGIWGGGLMRLGRMGEAGSELLATGQGRVFTSDQLNAPTVAAIHELRDEVRRLVDVTRGAARDRRVATAPMRDN